MSMVQSIAALKAADPTLIADMSAAAHALAAEDGAADAHSWLGCSPRERARGPVVMLSRLDSAHGIRRAGVVVLIDGTLDLLVSTSVGGEYLPLMDIEMNVHGLDPAMRMLEKDADPIRSSLVARLKIAAQATLSARTAA